MTAQSKAVVTGAFGFTSRHVAERLLAEGQRVTTLTSHPDPSSPLAEEIDVEPYDFDDPEALESSLSGADTLYNSYWVRSPHQGTTFAEAVENSRTLIEAAEDAGVRRIVHFSVSNARASSLPYFRGKARVERLVESSDLGHAILRPTLIFGLGDRLVNNLAWFLRRSPVFPVFGDGDYPVRPVYVGDVADLAVELGGVADDRVVDAAGPDTLAFEAFVRLLARHLDAGCRIVHAPPGLAYLGTRLLGTMLDDVLLTRNEIRGLMDGLLTTDGPPSGETRLDAWLQENAHALGTSYERFLRR
jgi:NADH dehydrogenase